MPATNASRLELARAAAKAFCEHFDFPSQQLQELDGPTLFDPVPLDRDGRSVTAYRWLGGGRGGPYVQVELPDDGDGDVVVYGGDAHREFGPWRYDAPAQ